MNKDGEIQELAAELAEVTEECRQLKSVLRTIWDDDEIELRVAEEMRRQNESSSRL